MTTAFNVGGVIEPRPFKIQRLGHIGLTVPDIDESSSFYCDNLGFRMSDALQPPGMPKPIVNFNTVHADHHSLVHVDAMLEADNEDLTKGITVNQLSFQVGTLEEVVNGTTYFKEQGSGVWRYGRDFPGSNWATYTYDPDGHRVELFYGMEQIGWDRRVKPPALYTPPDYQPVLPERSELTEVLGIDAAEGLPAGFRPDEPMASDYAVGGVQLQRPFAVNSIGPAHIFVEDLDTSIDFYGNHIGLVLTEVVEWHGHRAAFFRCGTNHHVIGLFPLALRSELGVDPRTYLMSLGVELRSYAQLRNAVSWLRGRGVPVRTDLPPELRPGIGYAALTTDPNGHNALLYCGMEQIGWDGRHRPAADRPPLADTWPEVLPKEFDAYSMLGRLGPLG